MFHIEFIGVPGSGKTTIRKKLIERLRYVNKKKYLSIEDAFLEVSRKKIDKAYRIILNILPKRFALIASNSLISRNLFQYNEQNLFLAKYGKSFDFFFTSSMFEEMPLNEKKIVISGFLEIGSLYECVANYFSNEMVIFFEEGFIQKSFMFISPLINKDTDKTNLIGFLDNIPLPDLTIYINADLKTCYARMQTRTKGLTERLRQLEQLDIMNFLEKSDKHVRNVSSWLQKNKNLNVLEINNDKELDNILDVLEKKITILTTNG